MAFHSIGPEIAAQLWVWRFRRKITWGPVEQFCGTGMFIAADWLKNSNVEAEFRGVFDNWL